MEEELAKKASKQTRDHDESMLEVCHTCHVPVYYGGPIYKLQNRDYETNYTGIAGGGYSSEVGVGGVTWKAKKRTHSETERDEYNVGSAMALGKRKRKPLNIEKNDET